ncbi:uncharacterized protein LOC110008540 [Amborella trichopoda]|uniref:uncharacterized protein LOC110008540 n=1 Tax=Amborella trichopoda TaxID=13333 RepID=UPI0009C0B301|nr:uncharacterized protein LOC110008540 [Amborella trichopoda]|eukprot:XP_020532166.1 uncharacterized protein LOC110008540 [Amborella trichopoda]
MGLETLPLAMVMTEIRKCRNIKEATKEKVSQNANMVNPINDAVCTPAGNASVKAKGKKIFRRGFRLLVRLEAQGILKGGYLNAGISFREPELVDVGSSSSSSIEDEDWESMDLTEARDGVDPSGPAFPSGCNYGANHLLYADETVIFCEALVPTATSIKHSNIIDDFYRVIGQKLNCNKGNVMLFKVNTSLRAQVLDTLQFKLGDLPARYLGLLSFMGV